MLTLLFITTLALITLIVGHIYILFGIFIPSHRLIISFNIGVLAIPSLRYLISKTLQLTDEEKSLKSLASAIPLIIKIVLGFLIFYSIIAFVLFLYRAFNIVITTDDIIGFRRNFYKSLSAVIMVIYSAEFFMLYGYNNIKKTFVKCCVNGHRVSSLASHCEICGTDLKEDVDATSI